MKRNALLETVEADWSHRGPPPEGVTLENLRRRGLDMLRIHVAALPGPGKRHRFAHLLASAMAAAGGHLLAGPTAGAAFGTVYLLMAWARTRRSEFTGWTLTVQGERMLIAADGRETELTEPTILPLAAVDGVTVVGGDGIVAEHARLRLEAGREHAEIGHGLPLSTLQWLRAYLALEVAGLTWRPLSRSSAGGPPKGENAADHEEAGQAEAPDPLPEPIGAATTPKIARLYLVEVDEHLERLVRAVEKGEPVAIRREAHWLKSTGANIGARHLSDLAQRLEFDALDNALDDRAVSLAAILDENERVVTALRQRIGEGGAGSSLALPPPAASLPRFRLGKRSSATRTGEASDSEGETKAVETLAQGAAPAVTSETFSARVLVIDDSLVNQEVAAEMLGALGCSVVKADNGRAGLEAVEAGYFDLVLMDCLMPVMDGFEATRRIRSREAEGGLARMPIVALTGNTSPSDRERCLQAGMDGLIGKPLAEEELEHTLRQWVAGRLGEAGGDRPAAHGAVGRAASA
jgi:CheY-like chemotaxis protein